MNNTIDYAALGARIRQARQNKGLTQEALGEACQLSTAHIGHIERGTRIPSLESFYQIATVLQVSTDFLLFDSFPTNTNLLYHIEPLLKKADKNQVNTFMNTLRILIDKIDEL